MDHSKLSGSSLQFSILSSAVRGYLSALEEQNGDLAQVEVDEMPGLVGDVRAEVPAHDAMPSGVVLLVELFLDVRRDILLDVVLFESLSRAVDGVLLHLFAHIGIFDDGFSLGHFERIFDSKTFRLFEVLLSRI